MKKFFQIIFIFLAITGLVSLLNNHTQITFGHNNFWDHRGYIGGMVFLLFITLFPRLTLILSSVPSGGLLWWLGLIFAPRVLVAILAVINYWDKNPLLVVMASLVAIGGESTEKIYLRRRKKSFHFKSEKAAVDSSQVFETEFKEL